jgi:endo-1,4-beta-mannosidase
LAIVVVELTAATSTGAERRGRNLVRPHAMIVSTVLGFTKMIVSTAEIQKAADKFYRRNGFQQIRVEVAETMNTKQAGGGLTCFHFEKGLQEIARWAR